MQSRRRASLFRLLAATLALDIAACQPAVVIPETLYTPTVAGVVAVTTPGSGRTTVYTLADGTSVTIDHGVALALDGSGSGSVGDLLLTDDTSAFVSSLRIDPNPDLAPGCFGLRENGLDDGDHIKIENGLRLPKAADFDPGQAQGGVYQIPLHAFCVNGSGEVTLYH